MQHRSPQFHNLRALDRQFFARDPREVARELLGKLLIRRHERKLLAGRLVEVEAYLGADDAAAHAAAGRTARNDVLFGPPGHAYVYLIYGNYFCLNVSCEPEGKAGCVLIRAAEPVDGLEHMARSRGLELGSPKALRLIASGPGRLAQAFSITRARDNGKDLLDAISDLRLADDGYTPQRILTTPRIGITKTADYPLRYIVAGSDYLSGPKKMNGR